LGYKGLIALARRSNTIKTIAAEPIHENDIFECEFASGRHIHHKPDIFKERGEVIGYYCLVELSNGGEQFKVMSKKDVEKHRDKFSKAYDPKDSSNIWNKNFDAMALKTVVIQALKLCPISIEAMDAVIRDERADLKDVTDDIEYTVSDIPAETVEETPAIEEPKKEVQQPKKEPIQPSFDEMNGITDEEMAAADAAFDSAPKNVNDIF
jgi:recombination protein RecT